MGRQNWKPGNMLYPVPAVMVSCKRPGEKANIITVAWAGTICSDPAMVSISVRPDRYSHNIIEESPVCIECKVREIKRLGSHDMFIAEVVNVSVDESYMDSKGKFMLNSTNLVTYSHGEYFVLGRKIGKFGYSVQRKRK